MVGITNRDPREEEQRQEIVEEHREHLLPADQGGGKYEKPGDAQQRDIEEQGRVKETGVGPGTELLEEDR